MADDRSAATGLARRGARESFAERRERRAAVDDPAVVLEAAARFLEVRVAVGRRGPAPADAGRLSGRPGRGRHRPADRARDARRRGVRAGLGRVARPGAAARRARHPRRAPHQGRRPGRRSTRPGRAARGCSDDGPTTAPDGPGVADRAAAERLSPSTPGRWPASPIPPAPPAGLRAAGPQRLRSRDVPGGRRDGRGRWPTEPDARGGRGVAGRRYQRDATSTRRRRRRQPRFAEPRCCAARAGR